MRDTVTKRISRAPPRGHPEVTCAGGTLRDYPSETNSLAHHTSSLHSPPSPPLTLDPDSLDIDDAAPPSDPSDAESDDEVLGELAGE